MINIEDLKINLKDLFNQIYLVGEIASDIYFTFELQRRFAYIINNQDEIDDEDFKEESEAMYRIDDALKRYRQWISDEGGLSEDEYEYEYLVSIDSKYTYIDFFKFYIAKKKIEYANLDLFNFEHNPLSFYSVNRDIVLEIDAILSINIKDKLTNDQNKELISRVSHIIFFLNRYAKERIASRQLYIDKINYLVEYIDNNYSLKHLYICCKSWSIKNYDFEKGLEGAFGEYSYSDSVLFGDRFVTIKNIIEIINDHGINRHYMNSFKEADNTNFVMQKYFNYKYFNFYDFPYCFYSRNYDTFDTLCKSLIAQIDNDPNFEKAAKGCCNNGITWAKLARGDSSIEEREKFYKYAIEEFSFAIRMNPNLPISYFDRSLAYYNLEKYMLALKDVERAISLEPDNKNCKQLHSLILEQMKKDNLKS